MRKSALMAGAMLLAIGSTPVLAWTAAPAPQDPANSSIVRVATSGYANLSYSLRSVQTLLNALGYPAGTADGVMGAKTRAAIRAFQTDSGLPVSGQPSYNLFDALQEAMAGQFGTVQPTQPVVAAPTVPANVVINIQSELRKRGYDIPGLTGRIDSQTTAAIRAYQQDAGLAVTGQANESLLASMQSLPTEPAQTYTRAEIAAVQKALAAKGYNPGVADGVVGPRVRTAIRTFQTDSDLPVTGALSPTLLAKLGVTAGATASTSTGASTSTSTSASLGASLTPPQRLSLEQDLAALGYDVGRVDGFLEAKTEAAIRDYQDSQDLSVDGKATVALLQDVQGTKQNLLQVQGQQILTIEQELAGLGYKVGPVDGKLDSTTAAAIKSYQQKNGLSVTGQAGTSLLTHLQSGSAAPAVSGKTVQSIEQALQQKGYAVGPIDGQVDASTQVAIEAFLRHNRLNLAAAPSESLLAAIQSSQLSAAEGQQSDLINTGVNALTNIITRGVQQQ